MHAIFWSLVLREKRSNKPRHEKGIIVSVILLDYLTICQAFPFSDRMLIESDLEFQFHTLEP